MKKYYTYILESQTNNQYYIGSTGDVKKRVKEHNSGKVKSTKHGLPWKLKYTETHNDLSSARIRETQIKNWKKRSAIEKLIHGPIV